MVDNRTLLQRRFLHCVLTIWHGNIRITGRVVKAVQYCMTIKGRRAPWRSAQPRGGLGNVNTQSQERGSVATWMAIGHKNSRTRYTRISPWAIQINQDCSACSYGAQEHQPRASRPKVVLVDGFQHLTKLSLPRYLV
jgi:hypothetical protein